ncbi:MAG: hypothetical protein HAW59_05350 [Betaproteobacteria bacterium]|nr:hypothetical protein [Betaproteobacteria bacterium]
MSKEETKAEKAADILKEKGIDECCGWLLSGYPFKIKEVPGVTNVKSGKTWLTFSYERNVYQLRYENLHPDLCPSDSDFLPPLSFGDFRLFLNNKEVLSTSYIRSHEEFGDVDSINVAAESIKRAVLGDWLDAIPRIVEQGKAIAEREKRKKKKEAERARDDNIDLGEYE